jgi:hypothetical protein
VNARVPRWVGFLASVVALAAAAGCVTPAPTDAVYEHKAALSAKGAVSDVATARLAVTTWLEHRIAGTYLEVVVVDAEDSIGSVVATFESVEAPDTPASTTLHDRTTEALGRAQDALTDLRIAVRRDDRAAIEALSPRLSAIIDALQPITIAPSASDR